MVFHDFSLAQGGIATVAKAMGKPIVENAKPSNGGVTKAIEKSDKETKSAQHTTAPRLVFRPGYRRVICRCT